MAPFQRALGQFAAEPLDFSGQDGESLDDGIAGGTFQAPSTRRHDLIGTCKDLCARLKFA